MLPHFMKIDFRDGKVGISERTSALRPFDKLREHRLRERMVAGVGVETKEA